MPGEAGTRPALIRKARFVFPSPFTLSPAAALFRHAAAGLLSIAFPSSCSLCQQELTDLNLSGVCGPCWAGLEPWHGPVCATCGLPFASAQSLDATEPICPVCRDGEMSFDGARSFGLYRDTLRAAILLLKFSRRERWGTKLGSLLAPVCEGLLAAGDAGEVILIPVPLHAARQRERGYNQAELLALGLVRTVEKSHNGAVLILDRKILKKTRATPPQAGLSVTARHANLRGVFAVTAPERVRDRVLILVDDVMTTGATLSSCALALKRAGARRVLGLTLARATPQFPDHGAPRMG